MYNPFTEYKVGRESGLGRFGAFWFAILMLILWPVVALSVWAAPKDKGFGKFKDRVPFKLDKEN